jgi:HSP20 family protein
MTTTTHFVPFRSPLEGAAVLQKPWNPAFNDSINRKLLKESLGAGDFMPPVDVHEDAAHLVLKLQVPGMPPENLQITLENLNLTVQGEHKLTRDGNEGNLLHIQRSFGSFVRRFTLPSTVDTDSARASYEDGVLSITLPKKQAMQRQLPIEIGRGSKAGLRQTEAPLAA